MSSTNLDLSNIQGDILSGLPKKTQTYVLFQIADATRFRQQLKLLVPLITTVAQVASDRSAIAKNKEDAAKKGITPPLLSLAGVNISFSHAGLVKLGITDDIGDPVFNAGQLADAQNLGDKGTTDSAGKFTPDWLPEFLGEIDGVILVSGSSHLTVTAQLAELELILLTSIKEVLRIVGDVRPGAEKGHEHFGFLDGISQPAVQGFDTNPNPGQETVRQGIMLLGRDGDNDANNNPIPRPSWAVDGSFIAFRYLKQLVPEFDGFLKTNAIANAPDGFLGARLMGRWKSGAPIDVTPLADNPAIGADPLQNNNFRYAFTDDSQTQDRCPFAAHTRKTNPRADLEDLGISTESRRIIRRGIQFGPELTPAEKASGKTQHDRGLVFVAYQSNIANGFQFIQHSWADNPGFPIQKPITPGLDAIIGQSLDGSPRALSGTNPNAQNNTLTLPAEWVVPLGGEYFFSPSISALKTKFATA